MKLLLDTHVVLWWRLDSTRLTKAVRQRVATADVVWVSAASGWEAAIKQRLGKLRLADSFSWMVEDSDFDELPVTLAMPSTWRRCRRTTPIPSIAC